MDRDYNEEDENKSGYEAGFSENQGDNLENNQGYAEDRSYAEERGYDAENRRRYQDQRGNALMLQSNAAQSLQVSALILALISLVAILPWNLKVSVWDGNMSYNSYILCIFFITCHKSHDIW